MLADAIVHPRANERHPELTEQDVLDAWEACIKYAPRMDRENDEVIAVGMDSRGRLLEMIARRIENGSFVIFHAFTPPTKKALFELGFTKRRES